ncbi:CIC11C00000005808 [Sungouiella intermedia]|uniref:CIC11C00000005808 n=1 Tax=Sungouiella intermedia TaxID=45354 RepID=A0A1L0FXN6_9ASCO|nr:CIC11C00000005808 [[Candida] intermedia]
MEHHYAMDPLDHKNQVPLNQMRRVYYGDDHELLRQQNAIDLKYPFPQAHLYPTSSSVRGAPMTSAGYLPQAPGGPPGVGQEVHMDDPRYVPQDLMSLMRDMEDKRMRGYYGYPLATQNNMPPVGSNPNLNANLNMNGANLNNGGISTANNISNTATNGLMPPGPPLHNQKKDDHGLVLPIPPLHVQQQIANNEDNVGKAETENVILSKCSRCKKDFVQRLIMPKDSNGEAGAEPKVYKLCHHCRDLQRQRSRRWQKKTKDKQGACRRCGTEIPPEEQKYVLCPQCRENLRIRKANRAAQGKCVHCLGPINALIIKDEGEDGARRLSTSGSYKVCQRCRENDKIRRTNLERMGNCNRCAKALSPSEQGKHKVCLSCRQKKKKLGSGSYSGPSGAPSGIQQPAMVGDVGQNVLVQPMNFIPADQAAMMMGQSQVSGMGNPVPVPQQEYPVAYGNYQPMLQAPQFSQIQPQDGTNQLPQMHGFQAPRSYLRDRM